jgi:patatin-like phospholipase/acyl hydrolase
MFKILAIDGGGIRGIIPAMILAEIEKRTGQKIAHLFDMIAGTSTGGILALGLSKPDPKSPNEPHYSARDLREIYEKDGSKIFPLDDWKKWSKGWEEMLVNTSVLKRINPFCVHERLSQPKYLVTSIEEILKSYFGDTYLQDSLTNTLITSYDIENRCPKIFCRSSAKEDACKDFLMRDVALATSAAPTYFKPAHIQSRAGQKDDDRRKYYTLVDGGVFANNPTMYAYADAMHTHPDEKEFLIVSLGTGEYTRSFSYEEAIHWGLLRWAQPLLSITFDGVSDSVDYQIKQLISEGRYYRFQTELKNVPDEMDNANSDNIEKLRGLANKLIDDEQDSLEKLCNLLQESREKSLVG